MVYTMPPSLSIQLNNATLYNLEHCWKYRIYVIDTDSKCVNAN